MKAAVLETVGEPIRVYDDIDIIEPRAGEIRVDVKYCGVCHSDVHVAYDELQPYKVTKYPCVPGHELAGIATKVGKNVINIREGDKVGVGKFD